MMRHIKEKFQPLLKIIKIENYRKHFFLKKKKFLDKKIILKTLQIKCRVFLFFLLVVLKKFNIFAE